MPLLRSSVESADFTRTVIKGQECLNFDAAMLAVDHVPFGVVAVHFHRKFEMSQSSACKVQQAMPGVLAAFLGEAGAKGGDIARKEAEGVEQVSAVRDQRIVTPVGSLRVDRRP